MIIIIGIGLRLAFSWQPIEHLVSFPLVDDALSSLTIAHNIVLGNGLICDGIKYFRKNNYTNRDCFGFASQ